MKLLYTAKDAAPLYDATIFFKTALVIREGTLVQQKALEVLQHKINMVNAKTEYLEFDVFEAVRTYDLLEYILEEACAFPDRYVHSQVFLYITKIAILRTTLKYGVIDRGCG